jgi:hypothetical protein
MSTKSLPLLFECRVRWYVASFGNEDAIHTAHWHGISFNHSGHHVDQMIVQSSSMLVLDAYTDNPGTWLFHCHLTDHIEGGMMAVFHINGTAPALKLNGKVCLAGCLPMVEGLD